MYSTRTTRRESTSTIENLAFADIAATYSALFRTSSQRWSEKREDYIEKRKHAFNLKWSETHEAPYEGGYEDQDFEEAADILFGTRCAELGSPEEAEFTLYLTEWSNKHKIKVNAEWVFGQMLAKFAEMDLTLQDNDLYDPVEVYRKLRESPFMSGMLLVARYTTRSMFITGQTDVKYRNYCALVPLVLSAFKKFHNIPYSKWSPKGLGLLVEPNLLKAMSMTKLPDITKEEVIEIRTTALTPKSGSKIGIMSNPANTYRLYIPAGTELSGLPTLANIMICQTWCAHPLNRTNQMVLNPVSWDDVPAELISTSITPTRLVKSRAEAALDDSW